MSREIQKLAKFYAKLREKNVYDHANEEFLWQGKATENAINEASNYKSNLNCHLSVFWQNFDSQNFNRHMSIFPSTDIAKPREKLFNVCDFFFCVACLFPLFPPYRDHRFQEFIKNFYLQNSDEFSSVLCSFSLFQFFFPDKTTWKVLGRTLEKS